MDRLPGPHLHIMLWNRTMVMSRKRIFISKWGKERRKFVTQWLERGIAGQNVGQG